MPESVKPATTEQEPSSRYLFAACCTLEAAHEHEDLERAKAMLDRYGLTYETAIAELERRGVIGPAVVSDEGR